MITWHVITVTVLAIHGASVSGLDVMSAAHTDCAEVQTAEELSSKVALAGSSETCYSVRHMTCALNRLFVDHAVIAWFQPCDPCAIACSS